MPDYQYSAQDKEGKTIKGHRSSLSAEDLALQLQQEGLIPLDIVIARHLENKPSIAWKRPAWLTPKVPKEELQIFCRQMYTLIKAGIPLATGVARLAETTKNKQLSDAFTQILATLNQGRSLYVGLGQFPGIFSDFFVNLVKVGESTGRLDTVFLHLADYLELEVDTVKKIKTALRYPIMVVVSMLVALLVINVFVIPAFAGLFASFKGTLPLPTRILMATSNFIIHYWMLGIGMVLGIALVVRTYIRTPIGTLNWAHLQLKIPIIGWLIHRILLARFARLYALVLRSGLTAVDGIELVGASTGNAYVASRIKTVTNLIGRGNSISSAIAQTHLFPPLMVQMITLGEESGNIDTLLDEVGDFYEREINYDLVRLSDAIEPILLVIMAGMVLILALGVFLPMWTLASAMQR